MTAHSSPRYPQTTLRPASEVMRLARMGAFFPTRLSFMRALIRQLSEEDAVVARPVWEMSPEGYGRAVYSVPLSGYTYSLIAFTRALDAADRTDRVIATAWDAAFVLFDGVPDAADLDRLEREVPRQEAGRCSQTELILSRANKSVRFFSHVVERLVQGQQPDPALVREVGYLMRTTAVYGNGKFGVADRDQFAGRDGMAFPFRAEMLAVWLIRGFTLDLVEHIAAAQNPGAAKLAPEVKRRLGIGNSTGLGMAPFLVNHPQLLNNWMTARETALARVLAVETAGASQIARIGRLMKRVGLHLADWQTNDRIQADRIAQLREEWAVLSDLTDAEWLTAPHPWKRLLGETSAMSMEAQELTVALVLEVNGTLIDGLVGCMDASEPPPLDGAMHTAALARLIERDWGFALDIDFDDPDAIAQFWYVSEEKLEPRFGNRHDEPGAERELPLDIARQVQALAKDLEGAAMSVARFLANFPHHRAATRRVQALVFAPYGEIRDNLISSDCRPIDLLRCKLSFFGASKFDPKSDLWTRITLFQGAPSFEDIGRADADDWWLPALL